MQEKAKDRLKVFALFCLFPFALIYALACAILAWWLMFKISEALWSVAVHVVCMMERTCG